MRDAHDILHYTEPNLLGLLARFGIFSVCYKTPLFGSVRYALFSDIAFSPLLGLLESRFPVSFVALYAPPITVL